MNLVQKLSDNTKEYIDNFFRILDEMAENMKAVTPTSSISQTFIMQMIPHHEAAIKMSENILKFTTDTTIEQLAKTIITGQTRDITRMKNMLNECAEKTNCEVDVNLYQREYNQIFDTMINKMNNSSTSNNLNMDFLSEMIPHHEGAINMSKNLLKFEICEELKNLAENIIVNQSAELQQMQNLIRNKI